MRSERSGPTAKRRRNPDIAENVADPPSTRRHPPTIRDVARRAGVSPATVSSVVTGLRPVAEDSRRAVVAAIEELSFKPNHMASSLRIGKTRTVGVVVPNLGNEFFASLVRGYEREAAKVGYELLVVSSRDDPVTETSRIGSLIARRVDGLLVAPASHKFGVTSISNMPPTVLVDRNFDHPQLDTVASENYKAGKMGCEYLLKLGHRDVTVLITGSAFDSVHDRVKGYRTALRKAGIPSRERIVTGGDTIEDCRAAIEQELHRPDRPTAIFAVTYFATLGAVKAVNSVGLKFPEQISLVGFEHSEWMTSVRPYITAICQQVDRLALDSWRLLHRRMAGETAKPEHVRLPCMLNVRESARAPLTIDLPSDRKHLQPERRLSD